MDNISYGQSYRPLSVFSTLVLYLIVLHYLLKQVFNSLFWKKNTLYVASLREFFVYILFEVLNPLGEQWKELFAMLFLRVDYHYFYSVALIP